MRIIAGRHRGVPLIAPPGRTTRPITDQVKESLFNILGNRLGTLSAIPPVQVMDLFAGSGGLGLEALSRGAAGCTFFEQDRKAQAVLRSNIEKIGAQECCKLVTESIWRLRFDERAASCGLMFVDPPYVASRDAGRLAELLERAAVALERAAGVLVLRLESTAGFGSADVRGLRVLDERVFGTQRVLLCGTEGGSRGLAEPPRPQVGLASAENEPSA